MNEFDSRDDPFMPRNTMTVEEAKALVAELRSFRKRLAETSSNHTRRSGLRRSLDAVIDELDELGFVLTGDREALLDRLHSTPGP